MATKQRGHAGDSSPARPATEPPAPPQSDDAGVENFQENALREETKVMPAYGIRAQMPAEGVAVMGEAVRRVAPESAEFLIELTASAPTAAQALRDVNHKSTQIAQVA